MDQFESAAQLLALVCPGQFTQRSSLFQPLDEQGSATLWCWSRLGFNAEDELAQAQLPPGLNALLFWIPLQEIVPATLSFSQAIELVARQRQGQLNFAVPLAHIQPGDC